MPLPERLTSDDPQPDAELLRFIDRRREREARRRRRLWLFGTAAAGVIVLAVASYLVVGRATEPSGRVPVATAPPSSPTPTPTAPPAEAPPAPLPAPRTDDAATSSPSPQPRAADVERAEPATPPPARERPPARRLPRSDVPPARWVEVQPAASDSVRRTATWLVQTHGRQEAEARAATVAEFYAGEQRAFWRRVLEEVRRTPER